MTVLPPKRTPEADEIEQFMAELAEETGVSRSFLEDARALIARAFTEVPPENRPECLDNIRLTVRTQAETEIAVKRSMDSAQQLIQAEKTLLSQLETLKKEALAAKEQAAAAALGIYRLRHPSPEMN